jgi:hypothetical protein
LADERALDAPALAVPRPIPLVAVEVESLHFGNGKPLRHELVGDGKRLVEDRGQRVTTGVGDVPATTEGVPQLVKTARRKDSWFDGTLAS